MAHKQLVEVCNFPETTIPVELDQSSINWSPVCINGIQWYVADINTVNNTNGLTIATQKFYKQGINGVVTVTSPANINLGIDGYCTLSPDKEFLHGCEVTPITIPAPIGLITTTATTLSYSNANWNAIVTPASPSFIVEALVDWGDGLYDSVKAVGMFGAIVHTPTSVLPTGSYEGRIYLRTIDGQWFLHTDFTWAYNQATNIVGSMSAQGNGILSYRRVRNIVQVRDIVANTISYTTDGGATTTLGVGNEFYIDCKIPSSTNSIDTPFLSNGLSAVELTTTQRIHENFVVIGTTPLVIPAGAISISVTKTNNTGVVNISGDNGTVFPLTFNRENFTDSVNEAVSTLSAYTITGTLAGTTYKVHIIR